MSKVFFKKRFLKKMLHGMRAKKSRAERSPSYVEVYCDRYPVVFWGTNTVLVAVASHA